MAKLTNKIQRFCEEFIIDMNGAQAAIRAGYSKRSAKEQASALLTKHNVQDYIAELRAGQQERTGVTADMVLKELGKLAFGDIRNIYNEDGRMLQPHELSDEAAATISSFKVRHESTGEGQAPDVIEEYKRYDKPRALEMLGRHFGMFTDKVEHSGEVGGVLALPTPVTAEEWTKVAKSQQVAIKKDE